MNRLTNSGRRLLRVTCVPLMMLLITSCATAPPVILESYKTVKLQKGEAATNPGWIVSDQALTLLLEKAKACSGAK